MEFLRISNSDLLNKHQFKRNSSILNGGIFDSGEPCVHIKALDTFSMYHMMGLYFYGLWSQLQNCAIITIYHNYSG